MTEEKDREQSDKATPEEIRALLLRLSRDKYGVSAHLAIRVDLEHLSSIEASRAKAARTTYFMHHDEE